MIYVQFVNKPSDSVTGLESNKEDDDVISFHILFS